jgi:hypothetical protein
VLESKTIKLIYLWLILIYEIMDTYYTLFSYQTGYIMWHFRLRIYIPWGAAEGNIHHKLDILVFIILLWQIISHITVFITCFVLIGFSVLYIYGPGVTLFHFRVVLCFLSFNCYTGWIQMLNKFKIIIKGWIKYDIRERL